MIRPETEVGVAFMNAMRGIPVGEMYAYDLRVRRSVRTGTWQVCYQQTMSGETRMTEQTRELETLLQRDMP